MRKRVTTVLLTCLALATLDGAAHVRGLAPAPARSAGQRWLESGGLSTGAPTSISEELQARVIADGLIRGSGWAARDCTDVVRVVGEETSDSFSFCFAYQDNHQSTLVAVDRIFRDLHYQWEEVGWTEFPEAIGAIYRSTSDPTRYLVVIIAAYHDNEGYTDVIVGVARDEE